MISTAQSLICTKYGVEPMETPYDMKAGVAENVRSGLVPVNGLRHPPTGDSSGWYIWAGEEWSDDAEFFLPIHVKHLEIWRPEVLRYLALPPGWRFLVAGEYEDIWFDESLLNV